MNPHKEKVKAYQYINNIHPWQLNQCHIREAYIQIAIAYADSLDIDEERNLNFFCKIPLNGCQAMEVAQKIIHQYNNFGLQAVEKVVDFFHSDSRYYFAREGSVCLYVKPARQFNFHNIKYHMFKEDELDFDPRLDLIRIWWD